VSDVVGKKYADASKLVQQMGGTPIIATRVGSNLGQDECIVTNAWVGSFVRDGRRGDGEIMVALNCNGKVASAGSPGNSAASPEGRQAKAAGDAAG
jgi:hypothetical protein